MRLQAAGPLCSPSSVGGATWMVTTPSTLLWPPTSYWSCWSEEAEHGKKGSSTGCHEWDKAEAAESRSRWQEETLVLPWSWMHHHQAPQSHKGKHSPSGTHSLLVFPVLSGVPLPSFPCWLSPRIFYHIQLPPLLPSFLVPGASTSPHHHLSPTNATTLSPLGSVIPTPTSAPTINKPGGKNHTGSHYATSRAPS